MRCAKCGATSQEGKRFCADCGAAMLAVVLSEPAPRSVAGSGTVAPTERIQSERRHLTVLFGDLVNSTRLAAERDPEEWRDIATECLEAAGDAIKDLGGYVARYMGDGVLAYFGWPTASEDDAERAVRAGLQEKQVLSSRFVWESTVDGWSLTSWAPTKSRSSAIRRTSRRAFRQGAPPIPF